MTMTEPVQKTTPSAPLYDPRYEHDACGIGAVWISGRKSYRTWTTLEVQ